MRSFALTAGIVLFAGGVLYFYIGPVVKSGVDVVWPREFSGLDEARSYYSILSMFFGVLSASAGLILGYFYYMDRKRNDECRISNDRKRAQLRFLLDELNEYDQLVDQIISLDIDDEKQLGFARNRIRKKFEHVEAMLEQASSLLGLTDAECQVILRVNSYVDKNDLIMQLPYGELSRAALSTTRVPYADCVRAARSLCYSKIA